MNEKNAVKLNGYVGIAGITALFILATYLLLDAAFKENEMGLILPIVLYCIGGVVCSGFSIVQPNASNVVTLLGTYVGVIREPGIWLTLPFTVRKRVSLRVTNFNSEKLKVNDFEGNPIEIAAVIVYKVENSAKATFDVEKYESFVQIQSEIGIRHIASQYAYDHFGDTTTMTLRKNSDEIAHILAEDLQERLQLAGVTVIEARIIHLAYSSEIASAMLQRQQAQAILSARKVIVDGAVGLIKGAIDQLAEQDIIELDDDKKAQMINNLMVAIISEKGTQPIINNGSIH
ncbi:MAG: SPFH domain-containing protein [Bacilli bacterium]